MASTPELLKYVREQLQAGVSREVIQEMLTKAGWEEADVREALGGVAPQASQGVSTSPRPQVTDITEETKVSEPRGEATTSLPQTSAEQGASVVHKNYANEEVPRVSPLTLSTAPHEDVSKPQQSGSRSVKVGKILGIGGAILFVGVASAGAFAYYRFILNPVFSPEEVLEKAMAAMWGIRAYEYSGELRVTGAPSDTLSGLHNDLSNAALLVPVGGRLLAQFFGEPFTLPPTNRGITLLIKANGGFDALDPANQKFSMALHADMDMDAEGLAVATSYGVEMRNVDRVFYGRLTAFPDIFSLGLGGDVDVSSVKGKWVSIDLQAIEDELKAQGVAIEALRERQPSPLSPEKIERIKDAMQTLKPLRLAEKLEDEVIDAVPVYHYYATIDKEALKAFVRRVTEIVLEDSMNAEELQRSLEIQDTELMKLDHAVFEGGEAWIGKNDFLPYKITQAFTTGDLKEQLPGVTVKIFATYALKNFNAPVPIGAPSDAVSITEVFDQLSQKLQESASSELPDTVAQ